MEICPMAVGVCAGQLKIGDEVTRGSVQLTLNHFLCLFFSLLSSLSKTRAENMTCFKAKNDIYTNMTLAQM